MDLDLLNGLNKEQREATVHTEGALLILAGGGCGKTRVLTHRIAYLIDNGVDPFNILAITFTNKAAKEMKERVSKISDKGEYVWTSTFHSMCVKILKQHIHKIGFDNSFNIYDTDDSMKVVKSCMKELNIDEKRFNPKTVYSIMSRAKDELVTPKKFNTIYANDFYNATVGKVYELYQDKLKSFNALDFNDLIMMTIVLFVNSKETLERYQDRFKYIMVDEYQDTNDAQYRLVKMLADKHKNICVVGDDDQSIYGWRGANIENILGFEKDYPNTKVVKLEQNYRSTQVILDAANTVIKNNSKRKDKALWSDVTDGTQIEYKACNDDREESQFVVEKIREANTDVYSNFAVLYRNNAQSRSIEDRLINANIPYKIYGGINFYDRKEIKDILSYLKLINNLSDEMALRRIINEPKRGIGDGTLDKIAEHAKYRGISMFKAMGEVDDIGGLGARGQKVSDFYDVMTTLKYRAETLPTVELIKEILDKTGYESALLFEANDEARGRLDNIYELVAKAEEFANNTENDDLATFLEEVALVADVDAYNENDEFVTLMTLHSSKGLEFDTVFIVGLEEDIFPSFRALNSENEEDIEEERRLCYVGITRAKRKLYMTRAGQRFQYGKYVYNRESRFMQEIPSELIQNHSLKVVDKQQERTFASRPEYTSNKDLGGYFKKPSTETLADFDIKVGDNVRHLRNGKGVVTAVEPAGADFRVTVDFEKGGEKKLMGIAAKLKKI